MASARRVPQAGPLRMATLVFSTVGTALGGPLGGAIGALIGQSIDQELLSPGSRGPRLGDLSVQTSTYGSEIPRIYGSMRVAGSVIWATDLTESTATTGAKGQPDTVYSYSVSLAIALSSRPLKSIKRIWADGKLLRGQDGDFKVSTVFRFYDGSDDQIRDPLIASVEGISSTPAYRGLALAVFENLELAEYGNRIPFLTFEVSADDEPPAAGSILRDATSNAIADVAGRPVIGYAAYGASMKAAVNPLVEALGLELFDDGAELRGNSGDAVTISEDDLGSTADSKPASAIQRELIAALDVPASLRLSYYDQALDYQSGEARATVSEKIGKVERTELPAVLDADVAKSLVQENVARRWAGRDRLTLRLPPKFLRLEPGSKVIAPLSPERWIVERCSIEAFVVIAELTPSRSALPSLPASAGRIIGEPDVVAGDAVLALLETPAALSPDVASIMVAASSPTAGWRSRAIEVSIGGQSNIARTAARKSRLGRAASDLPAGAPYAITDSVDVQLIDSGQWLTSCDDGALAAGANMAILGQEVIRFGDAIPIGPGRFQLGRLLRGREGTEAAETGHLAGEWFALVEPDAVRVIPLPSWAIGTEISVRETGVGAAPEVRTTVGVEASRPVRGSALILGGTQVVGTRRPGILSPTGGATIDSEARTVIADLLGAMRAHGLIEM
jgi:hypothetical protein